MPPTPGLNEVVGMAVVGAAFTAVAGDSTVAVVDSTAVVAAAFVAGTVVVSAEVTAVGSMAAWVDGGTVPVASDMVGAGEVVGDTVAAGDEVGAGVAGDTV